MKLSLRAVPLKSTKQLLFLNTQTTRAAEAHQGDGQSSLQKQTQSLMLQVRTEVKQLNGGKVEIFKIHTSR
jgi:hypothetical protein